MTALIIYFALALGVSFLCSLLESVILSVTPAYIANLQKEHPSSGGVLKRLKDRIDRPLAAILTLNTVANTVGAAGVGAQALRLWGSGYVAVASGLLTLSILICSEIIPKTLGTVHWRRLAPGSGYVILALIRLLLPLVLLLEFISGLISPRRRHAGLSRDEMMAAVQIGQTDGILHIQESLIMQNMLRLRNIRVKDILTPRRVMLAFQKDKTIAEVLEKHNPVRFSRIPVYGRDYDDIIGLVHHYKLMQLLADGKGRLTLAETTSSIHAIPDTKSVAAAMDEFIKRREHIFLVVDEYGGTAGIITLEDAIETLLGVEIVDEFDTVEDMRKWALQQWEKRKRQNK